MQAKSGKPPRPVPPRRPEAAQDADSADYGAAMAARAAEISKGAGKYGETPLPGHVPDPSKSDWVEIAMIDESFRRFG